MPPAATWTRPPDFSTGLLTGAETQHAQQNAIRRLDLVLDALKPETPQNQPNQPANADNKPPANANQPPNQQPNTVNLSELKLLKILQEDINRRTATLAATAVPDGQPSDQQRKEYEQLAEEQARLAELILKMIARKVRMKTLAVSHESILCENRAGDRPGF